MKSLPNISIILVGSMIGLPMVAQTALQPEVEHRETIQSRAAQAKAEGKTAVTFPFPGTSYPAVPGGLEHAATEFTVLVGTPRSLQAIPENDDTLIATWYSIAISEVIASHPCKMCTELTLNALRGSLMPKDLLPIPQGSMLLLRRGGTLTHDGVAVAQTENGTAALTVGRKYLFVVDKSQEGVARLVLNDAGIYLVGDDGETLSPLTPAGASSKLHNLPTLTQLKSAAKMGSKGAE